MVGMVINGEPCRVLADTGSDITQLTRGYYTQWSLSVRPLEELPGYWGPAEGAGRVQVYFHSYVVVKLESSDIKNYHKDVCTLVIDNTPFHNDTPLTIGTNVIDHTIRVMMESEQSILTEDWTRAVTA